MKPQQYVVAVCFVILKHVDGKSFVFILNVIGKCNENEIGRVSSWPSGMQFDIREERSTADAIHELFFISRATFEGKQRSTDSGKHCLAELGEKLHKISRGEPQDSVTELQRLGITCAMICCPYSPVQAIVERAHFKFGEMSREGAVSEKRELESY
uniref:Uncharacterized protein n=1 Tax=Glossina austeni TaxID=7395 RepID=A0A1A9VYW4_GLOAU